MGQGCSLRYVGGYFWAFADGQDAKVMWTILLPRISYFASTFTVTDSPFFQRIKEKVRTVRDRSEHGLYFRQDRVAYSHDRYWIEPFLNAVVYERQRAKPCLLAIHDTLRAFNNQVLGKGSD
jgi:hypothetical protein